MTSAKNETYTLWEVMKELDQNYFVDTINKEITDHEKNERWKLVP